MKIKTFNYTGRIYKNCDPSKAQQQALTSDQNWQATLKNSYQTLFGAGTAMYNSISSGLDTIIQKGREAMGFSPEELAAKRSESLNAAAAASKDVQRQIGARAATSGAVPGVESGVIQAERAAADTDILGQEANREANITEQGYATQRQAFDTAVKEKAGTFESAYTPSTQTAGQETQAAEATQQQANTNEAASSSWMGMVGGLANQAVGIGAKAIGVGV